jgi:serine/threonine-protein kinase
MDPVLAAAAARIGTWLGRKYVLEQLLGAGAMGAVFRARHRNGNAVAVKLLHADLMREPKVRTRFLREGYVANRIAHDGVTRVLDDEDDAEGHVYLVMELLEGESVESLVERGGGQLPVETTMVIAHDVLDVLQAAHDAGVIHRDIKPDNVFLTSLGTVKVLDFGIARILDESRLTRSGELLGTPAFMAPEQAGGRTAQIGPCTDIYSVGAMIYRMLTGQDVHEAKTPTMQMLMAATQPARSLAATMPSASRDLVSVVDLALAFEPQHRWKSARAMCTAIRQIHELNGKEHLFESFPGGGARARGLRPGA